MKAVSKDESVGGGRVMVVDDEEHNRELLRDLLEARGYSVMEAEDGPEGLERIRETLPDVVLLDLMMPRMDGFQVCRHLKQDPATAPIPILLVTSVTDRESRLVGIEAGANDFLSKPIDREDLLLRVHNAVFMKRLFDELQQSYKRLQKLETLRENLTHMIVHDLRSPLTGILACLQLLEMNSADRLTTDEQRYLQNASCSTTLLTEMISSILDVSRFEAGEMPLHAAQCELSRVATEAVEHLKPRLQLKQIRLDISSEETRVYCDRTIVGRVIANLVSNAVKFTPAGGNVRVAFECASHEVKVIVSDTGPGIPEQHQRRIFDKFAQVQAQTEDVVASTGLGLTFCRLAIEAHGGSIGVESALDAGSRFWFTLPPEMPSTTSNHLSAADASSRAVRQLVKN